MTADQFQPPNKNFTFQFFNFQFSFFFFQQRRCRTPLFTTQDTTTSTKEQQPQHHSEEIDVNLIDFTNSVFGSETPDYIYVPPPLAPLFLQQQQQQQQQQQVFSKTLVNQVSLQIQHAIGQYEQQPHEELYRQQIRGLHYVMNNYVCYIGTLLATFPSSSSLLTPKNIHHINPLGNGMTAYTNVHNKNKLDVYLRDAMIKKKIQPNHDENHNIRKKVTTSPLLAKQIVYQNRQNYSFFIQRPNDTESQYDELWLLNIQLFPIQSSWQYNRQQ